jgi:hypothetical protein
MHILAGMVANNTPDQIARSLIGTRTQTTGRRKGGVIGLNARQVEFIIDAEEKLRSGDPALMREYFRLTTRDKRFDATIRKAIESGKALPSETTTRAIERLRDRNLQLRGKTIARDQSITALRAGRHEGFKQLLDGGKVTEDQIERTWSDTGDGRERPSHALLDKQMVKGMSLPFISPLTGAQMMYPGDTSLGAPASETVQCRCFESIRIRYIR